MESILWLPGLGIGGSLLLVTQHISFFWWAAIPSFLGAFGTGIWLSMQSVPKPVDPSEPPTEILQGEKARSLRQYLVRWHSQFGDEFSSSDKNNLRNYLEKLVDRIIDGRQYDGVELRRRLRTSFKRYVDIHGTPAAEADHGWKQKKIASVVADKTESDHQVAVDCFVCATWRGTEYDAAYVEFITRDFDSLFL